MTDLDILIQAHWRLPAPPKAPREWLESEQRYTEPAQPVQRFEPAKPTASRCPTNLAWPKLNIGDKRTVRR